MQLSRMLEQLRKYNITGGITMAAQVTKQTLIGEMLQLDMGIAAILMASGMHCVGCPSSAMESLEEACMVHGIDVDELIEKLNS